MGGHSRKKLDLTGQRYGILTVLGPAENIGSRTAWRCRCDCGQETVVKTHHLRSGHTRSCGCQYGSGGPRYALGLSYIDGTCVEQLQAKTVRRNNTSGVPGVDWLSKRGRWRASICFKGRRYYLGSYVRFEDAVKARKRAEETLFEPFLREFAANVPQKAADGRFKSVRKGGRDTMSANVPPCSCPAATCAAGSGSGQTGALANPEKSGGAKPRN